MKAKHLFRECLKMDPSNDIKARVLNNLAMTYYWQKMPQYERKEEQSKFPRDADATIEKEFGTVIPLLKESIRCFEEVEKSEDQAYRLFMGRLLDPDTLGLPHIEVGSSESALEGLCVAAELRFYNSDTEHSRCYREVRSLEPILCQCLDHVWTEERERD